MSDPAATAEIKSFTRPPADFRPTLVPVSLTPEIGFCVAYRLTLSRPHRHPCSARLPFGPQAQLPRTEGLRKEPMKSGSSLGRYRITSKIGEGGMGQVFRAEDDRLHRHVAIKILPPEMSADPERLARLEREAHALAQLEHPNIAGIYGLEEGTPEGQPRSISFLVMQFAEGETLEARIKAGPVPLADALDIALQIARALEAAHDKGIIHRDLKPANVILSLDGHIKLLDFGLAKAYSASASGSVSPDLTNSPTLLGSTSLGMILGTAGYMSPEQARGKVVDRRTDVWAFGCVLYEMLSGRRLFDGETVTDVLGAIGHRDPDWSALQANTPPAIRSLLERCLRKDLNRRIQSIGDARIAIEEYLEHPAGHAALAAPSTPVPPKRPMALVPWALFGIAAATAIVLVMQRGGASATLPVSRFSVEIGENVLYESMGALDVTRDGGRVALVQNFGNGRRLSVRPMDQLAATAVVETGNPYNPFFSLDGQWIGYVTSSALLKVPTNGGTAMTLAEVSRSRGATWTSDDSIIIAAGPNNGLSRIPAAGGTLTPLTTLDQARKEVTHRWPQYVAGHDVVIFTSHTSGGAFDGATIEALNLKTGVRKTVYRGGTFGRYITSGHLVFANKDTIFAVPFDITSLEVTGSPAPVTQGVGYNPAEGSAHFAVADNGTLIYRGGGSVTPVYSAMWVDERGEGKPLWEGERSYGEAHLSPDGTKVAFMVLTDNNWDLWVYDRTRQVSTRLTFEDGTDGPGIWSPDGQHIAFSSTRQGASNIFRKRADGSGDVERLTESTVAQYVSSWSADGKYLLYSPLTNASDLWLLPLTGDRKPKEFLATRFTENEGVFSPDSRWIAYQSDESGRMEVYVRPMEGAGKWQVSQGGGGFPRWSGDGRQLFFRDNEGVMAVSVTVAGASLEVGRTRRAIKGTFRGGVSGILVAALRVPDYDVTRDGTHFVMYPPDSQTAGRSQHVNVVLNWFTELRRLLTARN
jgi:serine/threonine-protein kinase